MLVTGGTGFVGKVLTRRLNELGHRVRLLLRPARQNPSLPRGIGLEVALCSLQDDRGLAGALKGVDAVIHLAGAERQSSRANLMDVDVLGTQHLAEASARAGIDRLVFLSHLGADKSSAFAVHKAKALAESAILQSGVKYTIFRSAPLFGPEDQFSEPLTRLLRQSLGMVLMPGNGLSILQPLWVEDLVTCMVMALEDPTAAKTMYPVGGGEFLTFREILMDIMAVTGMRRLMVPMMPALLRGIAVTLEQRKRGFPVSVFLLDELASSHTCPIDSLPRQFGILPARFHKNLAYLKGIR